MYCDVTRRLELLRQVRLDVFDAGKSSEQLQRYFNPFKRHLFNIDIEEAGCSKNAWCC